MYFCIGNRIYNNSNKSNKLNTINICLQGKKKHSSENGL